MKYRLIVLLCFLIIVSGGYGCDSDDGSLTSLRPSSEAAIDVAKNKPVYGSVIQGSRADNNNITQDTVSVSISSGSISVDITTDNGDITLTCNEGSCFSSDDSSPARAEMFTGLNSDRVPEFNIGDRLVFGIWTYGEVWGMAVDELTESETPQTDIPSVNADTCYTGDAIVYYTVSANGVTSHHIRLEGVAVLTLADDGTIRGLITGIEGIPGQTTVRVILEQATAGSGGNELLYSGTTAIENIPGTRSNATGNWGAQFFGSNGGYLAGT